MKEKTDKNERGLRQLVLPLLRLHEQRAELEALPLD